MTKIIEACVLSGLAFIFVVPVVVSAASFERTLSFGTLNSPHVVQLQQFLHERGFFSEEATGNYLSVTRAAVTAFQISVGVDATGFFGPLTMAAANADIAGRLLQNNQEMSIGTQPEQVLGASVSRIDEIQPASVKVSSATNSKKTKTINWETTFYPEYATVDVQLVNKIASSPNKFELVRLVGSDIPNAGTYTWKVQATDYQKSDLYIILSCSSEYSFVNGCNAGVPLKY